MPASWPDVAAREVLDSISLELDAALIIQPDVSLVVEDLFCAKFINEHQRGDIYSGGTNLARIAKLLDYISRRGSTEIFVAFVNILGSERSGNLPEVRNELIRKYGKAGGNLDEFGVSSAAQIPNLSRTETDSKIHVKPWPSDVKDCLQTCPAVIRDVRISVFTEKPRIILLLDNNRCSRFFWEDGNKPTTLVSKKCPREFSMETADNILLLRPKLMALLWPRRIMYANIHFQQAEEDIVFQTTEPPVSADITCQTAIKDVIVTGDQAGNVTLFDDSSFSQFPQIALQSVVAGVTAFKVGEDYRLLAWTADGNIQMATVREGRFQDLLVSPSRLQQGYSLQACAGDFNKQFAMCVKVTGGKIVLNTFENGQPKLSNHCLGDDPKNCLQLMLEDEECVAVTGNRFVYVHKHVVVNQFYLPWKNIEHVRVERLGHYGHFLIVATRGTECFFSPIGPLNRLTTTSCR